MLGGRLLFLFFLFRLLSRCVHLFVGVRCGTVGASPAVSDGAAAAVAAACACGYRRVCPSGRGEPVRSFIELQWDRRTAATYCCSEYPGVHTYIPPACCFSSFTLSTEFDSALKRERTAVIMPPCLVYLTCGLQEVDTPFASTGRPTSRPAPSRAEGGGGGDGGGVRKARVPPP